MKKQKENKPYKFLDALLIILGVFLLLFISANIVIFCVYGSIPDTLVEKVLDCSTWEAIIAGVITITKNISKTKGNKNNGSVGMDDKT